MVVDVKFNRVFKEANNTKCRYRILYGGAGSGKSFNIAQDFIIKLIDEKYLGTNLLVIRKSNHSHKNSTFSEIQNAIFRIFGTQASSLWKINQNEMTIQCKLTGNSIIFRGINDSGQLEKIKSVSFPNGKLTWIWIEEATEISEVDFNILNDRLRGKLENNNLYYQITMSFNPTTSSHWIKSRFFHNPNKDTFICKSTYKDNSFIDTDYKSVMEFRKERDPEGYQVYALGEWGGIVD